MNDIAIFNDNQNASDLGNRVETTTKCGYIRIKGEKEDRQISWELYQKLINLPATYDGVVMLSELNLSVPYSQIAKIEAGESKTVEYKDFTRLPTKNVRLYTDLKPIPAKESITLDGISKFYMATVHYVEKNENQIELLLDKDKIKHLVLVELINGEEFVCESYEYGRQIYPVPSEA